VALASGVPIVASALGALSERLAGHRQSAVVRWNALPGEWNAALLAAAGLDAAPAAEPPAAAVESPAPPPSAVVIP
jgi:hypothetical protein